jgi:1-deoxy-D-xylulose-5-phosphate synthase
MVTGGTLFEELGFYYVGPIDGHNSTTAAACCETSATSTIGPVLIHVVTKKGKGYAPAENAADKYHGVNKFDVVTGEQAKGARQCAELHQGLRASLIAKPRRTRKIVAITAAMPTAPASIFRQRNSRTARSMSASPSSMR